MTRGTWIGLAVLAAGLILWPLATDENIHGYGVLAGVYALLGLSLIILVGWTGQISLGHAGFFGFGVYVGQRLLADKVPVLVTIPLVALFGAVVSLVLGIPSLRLRGVYLTIATLAFGLACQRYFFVLESVRGTNARVVPRPPIFGLKITSEGGLYYLILVVFALSALVLWNLRRTDTGRTLFAIRDSEDAAQAMAINIAPYKIAAFALWAALACVAGLFYGMHVLSTPGGDQFGVLQSLFYLAIPVIGGTENFVLGALIGGVSLAVSQPVVNEFHLKSPLLLAGVGLIVVLWSGFDGVTGMLRSAWVAARAATHGDEQVRYGSFVPGADDEADSSPPVVGLRVSGGLNPGSVVRARVVSRTSGSGAP